MSRRRQRGQARIIPTGWDDASGIPAGWDEAPGPEDRPASGTSAPASAQTRTEPEGRVGEAGKEKSRRRLIAIAAVLALVISLAIVLPALLNRGRGPEATVREYLDALVLGDTATLREHTSTGNGPGTAAMTDEVYSAATDRVQDYEVLEVRTEGESATATVLLDNGTHQYESTFTLTGHSRNFYSPLEWRIDPVDYGTVELLVPPFAEELLVNGTTMAMDRVRRPTVDGQYETVLQLLPGTYEIALPDRGELVAPLPLEITVLPSLGAEARYIRGQELGYDITEAGRQDIEQQVSSHLEDCADSQARQPDLCPFSVPVGEREAGQPSGGTWEILEQPQLEITPALNGGFDVVGTGGSARFTPHAGPDGTAQEAITVDFEVSALVFQDPGGGLHAIVLGASGRYGVVVCYDSETGQSSVSADAVTGTVDCA